MSEETPATTDPIEPASSNDATTEAAPIKRGQIGFNVSVQFILGLVLFGLINYLGLKHFKQWDKTYDREFTLSEDTQTFLKQLDKKLGVTVICHKISPEYKDMQQLLEGYMREGKGKLKIDMIDPVKDNVAFDKVTAEASRLGIKVDDMGIFIRVLKSSAEPAEPVPGKEETVPASSFIPLNSLFVYTKDVNQQSVLSGFNGEAALTGGLMGIAKGDQPKIYIVAHKSNFRFIPNMGNAVHEFTKMAARQNVVIRPFDFFDQQKIPDDASAIMLLDLVSDLDPRELNMLRDYWRGKHHGIFVMLNRKSEEKTPLLDGFLTENGVVPQQDRVITTYTTATGTDKQWDNTVTILDGSPITKAQKGMVTTIPGRSSSLKLTPEAEIPRTENIEIKPLLSPTSTFWGEMDYEDTAPQNGPGDNVPPLYTAASLERGASHDSQISIDSSRMIVLGNGTMMDPDNLTAPNQDFVNAALNWLLQRDKYIGINPTPRSTYTVKITAEQKNRIFLITSIVLPLVVFLIGVVVWGSRRS